MKRYLAFVILASCITGTSLGQLAANDAGLRRVTTKIWAQTGESVWVSGDFTNLGTEVLQTLNINWSVDEGETHSWVMDELNMSKSRDSSFVHPEALIVVGNQDITLKVWLSDPNGQQDEKSRNDTIYHTIQVIEQFPERHVLLEEFTGAWCGWCPRGPITYRDEILPNYPNVILAALHNGDDMVTTNGNAVVSSFAGSYPSGMIDRRAIGDRPITLGTGDWMPALKDFDKEFTPASINVYNYYWPDTYMWQIDVVVDFIMDYSGDLRLNCIILEDSVTGTGSGYNQYNYYNTLTDYPELEGAGNPITGYYHNHVVRDMLGGSWGASGIIPSKVKRGDRYIFSRTIKPKVDWDMRQIHLVGVLQAYSSTTAYRPVLNASKSSLEMATGYDVLDLQTSIKVYPNPIEKQAVVEISSSVNTHGKIEVINLSGQILDQQNLIISTGKNQYTLDSSSWKTGIYFIRFTSKDHSEVIKINKI